MKKLLYIFILFPFICFAQEKVIVEYENFTESDLSEIKSKEMLKMLQIANDTKFYYKLITSNNESSFKKIDRVDNSQNLYGYKMTSFESEKFLYKNFKENQTLTFEDYNGKQFIIQDSLQKQPWILEKEKLTFLGYDIKKAKFETENELFEAWYAPKLNIKNGPDKFSGLPGIILKIEITNKIADPKEKTYFIATKVELNDKEKITKPTKGQLISRKDYNKMSEENYKKYQENQQNSINKKID
jgi:GLPGLI family protein